MSDDVMVKIEHVSKQYRLGEIGGTTLYETFQRFRAKLFHKEDPTKKIGAKNYKKGEKFLALDDINLEIKKGERVGIIGHNGAGKSTLLKLLCRVTAPTSGTIGLNGRIASMLEVGTGFHPELTGRENVYMNGAILGMTKKEIDAKMEDIIEFSEVKEFIDTPVKRYSSGMYVKLAFAVAAHLDSEIMIMDEVLAVGDALFQQKCLQKMEDAAKSDNKSVLYVSHNMHTIRKLCDRVVVLSAGRIVFDGDVESGIDLYLHTDRTESFPNIINAAKLKRYSYFLQKVRLNLVTITGLSEAVVVRGNTISIVFDWDALDTVEGVRIWLTLRASSGESVATLVSKREIKAEKGRSYQTTCTVDTSFLGQATYDVSVIYFIKSKNDAVYRTLDHLSNLFQIQVLEDYQKEDSFQNWTNTAYGFIHYPDFVSEETRIIGDENS